MKFIVRHRRTGMYYQESSIYPLTSCMDLARVFDTSIEFDRLAIEAFKEYVENLEIIEFKE